jgi:hypothetical protein
MGMIKKVFEHIAKNPTETYNQFKKTQETLNQIFEPIKEHQKKVEEQKREKRRIKKARIKKVDGVKYKIKGNIAIVAGFSNYYDSYEAIEIQGTIVKNGKEYPVVAIKKSAFENESTLVNVEIKEGIKKIGESAFEMCNELEIVHLPKSLESIGNCAFAYCKKLKKIEIPDNVSYISPGAFDGNKKIILLGSSEYLKNFLQKMSSAEFDSDSIK